MKAYTKYFALALLLTFLSALPARAQVGAGLKVGYGFDIEEILLGGELHVVTPVEDVTFVPNLEIYLRDDPSILSFNGDFHYAPRVGAQSSIRPYVGLGLAITRVSRNNRSNTDAGINLIGGINFRTSGRTTPFIHLKLVEGDYDDLVLAGGVRFLL